jgi:hypothetical protein
MTVTTRTLAMALAVLAMTIGSAQAQGRHAGHRGASFHHGHHVPGHWRPGLYWGGVGLGVAIGVGSTYYGAPWVPGVVMLEPPLPAREPEASGAPDPVVYPRNGQSAAQTEADRQDCNRWATTQPSAMADAGVFHRATLACLDGRGYRVR